MWNLGVLPILKCLWFSLWLISPFTVNVLKFRTPKCPIKLHIQTVKTLIRLLLKEQSDQGLHCLQFQ